MYQYFGQPYQQNYQVPTQKTEIVKVNGENGARAFQLAPNSSALLLDENEPIVWLVQADGAGYKSISPYTITPYKPVPQANLSDIEARLKKIEEIINESNTSTANKQKKSNE